MKRSSKVVVRSALLAGIVLLALVVAPLTGYAAGPYTNALPPNSSAFGHTYAQWSAAWWQWVFNIPTPQSPLYDDTGKNCAQGQTGKVWFLAGTFSNNVTPAGDVYGTAERNCNIPLGKALFFPVVNSECSTAEPPYPTPAQMQKCATDSVNGVSSVAVTVDGAPVRGMALNSKFRVASGPFWFKLPQDNVLTATYGGNPTIAAGTYQTASDGYWVMLAPLSRGQHTVRIQGTIPLNAPNNFYLDVKYHLNVGGK